MSPLDRIEDDANKSRGSSNAPYVRRDDVLALVAVARAAQKAWSYGSTTLKSEDYYAVQEALARLDKPAEGGAR